MEHRIINCFMYEEKKTLNEMVKQFEKIYIPVNDFKTENNIINEVKKELRYMVRKNVLSKDNDIFTIQEKGRNMLNENKRYYIKIIINFFKTHLKRHKKLSQKEVRQEQQSLRNYLIKNKNQACSLCDKKLPLCLLETAHLKPRFQLNRIEIEDVNIVEFMCRFCHVLYDTGGLAVNNGLLQVSISTSSYSDLSCYKPNKEILCCSEKNFKYFKYHFENIYRK